MRYEDIKSAEDMIRWFYECKAAIAALDEEWVNVTPQCAFYEVYGKKLSVETLETVLHTPVEYTTYNYLGVGDESKGKEVLCFAMMAQAAFFNKGDEMGMYTLFDDLCVYTSLIPINFYDASY